MAYPSRSARLLLKLAKSCATGTSCGKDWLLSKHRLELKRSGSTAIPPGFAM